MSVRQATYVDSAAIVKLAARKDESVAVGPLLGSDLRRVVTYDLRMRSAAESLGLRVESPR
jgi:hypothetical protein